MTRQLALQANWVQPETVERWLGSMSIGKTLNVCCGMSNVGEIRIDTDPKSNRTMPGDLFEIKKQFPPGSVDTVICDPPFQYYALFKWLLALSDVPRKRLLISSDRVNLRRTFSQKRWKTRLYSVGDGSTLFIRLYWCFDRLNEFLEVSTS